MTEVDLNENQSQPDTNLVTGTDPENPNAIFVYDGSFQLPVTIGLTELAVELVDSDSQYDLVMTNADGSSGDPDMKVQRCSISNNYDCGLTFSQAIYKICVCVNSSPYHWVKVWH